LVLGGVAIHSLEKMRKLFLEYQTLIQLKNGIKDAFDEVLAFFQGKPFVPANARKNVEDQCDSFRTRNFCSKREYEAMTQLMEKEIERNLKKDPPMPFELERAEDEPEDGILFKFNSRSRVEPYYITLEKLVVNGGASNSTDVEERKEVSYASDYEVYKQYFLAYCARVKQMRIQDFNEKQEILGDEDSTGLINGILNLLERPKSMLGKIWNVIKRTVENPEYRFLLDLGSLSCFLFFVGDLFLPK